MLIRGTSFDDKQIDLRVEDDHIVAITDSASAPIEPEPGEEVWDGGMITPPFAEPHVHLDAALLGTRRPNLTGTLREGIANWAVLRENLTREDVLERARETLGWYARQGTLRVRTHVDTGSMVAVEALLELRESLAGGPMELQVVAFPQEGILRTSERRANWEEAVALGCDAVGAIPHFERTTEEGWESVKLAFDLAERHDRMVDLHCDETDDPGSRNLEVVCAQALDRGLTRPGQVVAGHCTAMHSYPNPHAAKVIELVAESRVVVVTNPLDNAVLQGRYDDYPRRRGHTRVDQLWAANALVAIGHDSVVDPWYRLGTANMLDPAWLLVHFAHLTGEEQIQRIFQTLHHENHLPFGGAAPLHTGAPARFLWFEHADPIEVIRHREPPRVVAPILDL
ncbi:MAG: amidohydrolase family protein [Myxococcota bacterium]|nr:amidohydrolase family protein [Myxococcota bacterium]